MRWVSDKPTFSTFKLFDFLECFLKKKTENIINCDSLFDQVVEAYDVRLFSLVMMNYGTLVIIKYDNF